MASKYYKVNIEKKTITIDRKITPTLADKEEVAMFLSGGYKLCHKSEAKSKRAKTEAAKKPNKEALEKLFKEEKYAEAKAIYENLQSNFFKARSEALKKIAEIDEKTTKA